MSLRRDAAAAPCLNCGYDLRAALIPGAGDIRCPECGHISPAYRLVGYGFNRAKVVKFIVLLTGPALVLVLSSWAFAIWSGNAIHVGFCLMLSPFAIAAHVYALQE